MLYNGLKVETNYTQMTLGISMLKNSFLLNIKMWIHDTCHWYAQQYLPLHTKTQNYHLKYSNVLR